MEKVSEYLSRDGLLPLMQMRVSELKTVAMMLEKSLKSSLEGFLSISPHRKTCQYYWVDASPDRKETYISKDCLSIARSLAQRDYNKRVLSEIRLQIASLERCLARYNVSKLEDVFEKLHPARRELVVPLIYSDAEYVKKWESVIYEGKAIENKNSEMFTARGERVRSKSECIIADTLYRLKIPYRYEYPHLLLKPEDVIALQKRKRGECANAKRARSVRVYSDFTCLNVRTRQEFVWEHFGLMGDSSYADRMVGKMEMYAANGFLLGKNLIITLETNEKSLNPWMVENMASRYLL